MKIRCIFNDNQHRTILGQNSNVPIFGKIEEHKFSVNIKIDRLLIEIKIDFFFYPLKHIDVSEETALKTDQNYLDSIKI